MCIALVYELYFWKLQNALKPIYTKIIIATTSNIWYQFHCLSCIITYIFRRRQVFDAAQICDLLKGIIIVICCLVVNYMDMSMIYHIVRGQSIIKFYVFFNMLDVSSYYS